LATRITAEVRVIVGIATTLAQTVAAIKARMFIPIFCIWSRKTTNNIRPTYPISFQRYTDTSTEATAFTDAEKAVVAAAIQAIAAAASASISPATRLSAGLSATGVTTLGQLIQSLQTALVALQAAAEINWTTS
jgi:hypothetical protein